MITSHGSFDTSPNDKVRVVLVLVLGRNPYYIEYPGQATKHMNRFVKAMRILLPRGMARQYTCIVLFDGYAKYLQLRMACTKREERDTMV